MVVQCIYGWSDEGGENEDGREWRLPGLLLLLRSNPSSQWYYIAGGGKKKRKDRKTRKIRSEEKVEPVLSKTERTSETAGAF